MYLEKIVSKIEMNNVKKFLSKFDLNFDSSIDYTIGLYENDELIGTVSKERNIIKCFAIDINQQGRGLANTLLTNIRNQMIKEGFVTSMVFTKKSNKFLFEDMGYSEVASTDKVILLEQGSDINKVIEDIIFKYNIDVTKKRAMIVMNCNPFTLGHRYIIEQAYKDYDEVLVFVLEEDKSAFSFKTRYKLVCDGTKDLSGVKVIPSTNYIISSGTFPTYFLKEKDNMLEQYTKLDSVIIAEYFCKKLNIEARYLGTEQKCNVTNEYNKMISSILPQKGIKVNIVKRLEIDDDTISASKVRQLLKEKDFENLKKLVPSTTYNYLKAEYGYK